jgi:hypothetical protein
MIQIQSPDDIYPAVEELIELLKQHPTSKLSAILDHRMHKVAWTAGDELLGELRSVLTKARNAEAFDSDIFAQIDRLIVRINEKLKQ